MQSFVPRMLVLFSTYLGKMTERQCYLLANRHVLQPSDISPDTHSKPYNKTERVGTLGTKSETYGNMVTVTFCSGVSFTEDELRNYFIY